MKTTNLSIRIILLLALFLSIGLQSPDIVRAADLGVVYTSAELETAISTANSNGEADEITLGDDIALANPLIISGEITIHGNGFALYHYDPVGDPFRMLQVTGGPVILNNLTITMGRLSVGDGVGIDIAGGTLTLNNSTISHNEAQNGGGLACHDDCSLTINSSTISNNTAYYGGGIFCHSGCNLTVNNSTISGNTASGAGGGITDGTGTNAININNSTISNNTSPAGTGGGLDLFGSSTTTTIRNSIIANSITTNLDCYRFGGTLTSDGYNLVEDPDVTCSFIATGDITSQDPNLGSLTDNDGDTQTHALLTNSPAIDQIADGTNGCEAGNSIDQRGAVRAGQITLGDHRGGTSCDMGAYEYDSAYTPTAITLRVFGAHMSGNSWLYLATILAIVSIVVINWQYNGKRSRRNRESAT